MPLKAAPQPVVATPSWTGFYVGGSLGARWDQNDWTTVSRGEAPGPPLAISNNPVSFSQTSFRYGVYGGFNWQFAPRAVAGIEGDFAWASTSGVANGIPGVTPTALIPLITSTVSVSDRWDAGLRGRRGILVTPSVLVFGTGGVSWMRSDAKSTILVGWSFGGGIEWMLAPNWLLRGEYRYTRYNTWQATFLAGGGGLTPNSDLVNANIVTRTQTAFGGLAFKFGP